MEVAGQSKRSVETSLIKSLFHANTNLFVYSIHARLAKVIPKLNMTGNTAMKVGEGGTQIMRSFKA
jgi:hypothetical protein